MIVLSKLANALLMVSYTIFCCWEGECSSGDIETAKKSLSAMKYYLNIKEEIKLKLVMK